MDVGFYNFYTERVRDLKIKLSPKKEKNRFKHIYDVKMPRLMRGASNKHLNMIPDMQKAGTTGIFNSIENLLDRVKSANRGIWQVSKRQVIDISTKYQFAIPNDHYPTKHLGSTGIILWRKAANKYFLVKHKKKKYKQRRI